MEKTIERRREQRLRYHWPVWFAEDFNDALTQGQMVDLTSVSAKFNWYTDDNQPYPGQRLAARFSVPRFAADNSFDMENFVRTGNVYRINKVNSFLSQVVLKFTEPLPIKPAEQSDNGVDCHQIIKTATI